MRLSTAWQSLFCTEDAYSCTDGYSDNWGTELTNAGGTGANAVVAQYPSCDSACDTRTKCYALCVSHNAPVFNWMYQNAASGSYGCRCYSETQRASITLTGTGWTLCSKGL